MKRTVIRILAVVGGIVAFLLILLIVAGFLLNTSSVQNKLLKHSTALLSDKLGTAVDIDSISVDIFTQNLRLTGVCIEDQQQYKMLQIDQLEVDMDLLPLARNEVKVSSAQITGLQAELYRLSPDEPLNLQFLLDAFKKDENASPKVEKDSTDKKKLTFDIDDIDLTDIQVKYNDMVGHFDRLTYGKGLLGSGKGELKGFHITWKQQTKKGTQDNAASIQKLTYQEKGTQRHVAIDGLHFTTDNHLPRKNVGKPKRGAFDAGHMDVMANLQIVVNLLQKDSLEAAVTHAKLTDVTAGIHINELTMVIAANKKTANLANIDIHLDKTTLTIAQAAFQLPSKKENRPLAYHASGISGNVLLKDIAKPFAPVLSAFDLPLQLKTQLQGDNTSMRFSDVSVSTTDGKLRISAYGGIKNLQDSRKLDIRFHIGNMQAKRGIKELIISKFPVKRLMMKQLHMLGNISYQGDMAVLWRKEMFNGLLTTEVGNVNFAFTLDDSNKYVFGSLNTGKLELGKLFAVDHLGPVACEADFRFDISKPRTAAMRREKGGKLPIGQVHAKVAEGCYKMLKVKNFYADVTSDGATATGDIAVKGKRTDLLCSFSLTSTDSIKSKLKIKPGIRFHKLSEEDRQAQADAKQKKQQEKEVRQQQKAEAKALKAQQKADAKARKAAEKAARKAAKQNGN